MFYDLKNQIMLLSDLEKDSDETIESRKTVSITTIDKNSIKTVSLETYNNFQNWPNKNTIQLLTREEIGFQIKLV